MNNGFCTDGVNSYTCACQTGFTGTNCETSKIICDRVGGNWWYKNIKHKCAVMWNSLVYRDSYGTSQAKIL